MSPGLGPLFKVELVTAARRWQTFALRSGLVVALLAALGFVYTNRHGLSGVRVPSLNEYAALGQQFSCAVLATQLAVILLAAPAATAGAICIDKSRGNMTLLMTSTLTNAEIVLGKLGGRMIPVFCLIAASVPVLFIAMLLGGISGEDLFGGFIVIFCAAILAATVALFFSIWVGRTHEALLLTYFVICVWVLAYPAIDGMFGLSGPMAVGLLLLNPFALMFAPLQQNWVTEWSDYFRYLATTLGAAVTIIGVAIWQIRRTVLAQTHQKAKRGKPGTNRRFQSVHLLDLAPMRWYERHRKRPSRAGRLVNWLFVGSAFGCSVIAIVQTWFQSGRGEFAIFVNMFQVGIGLLLTTVNAVTALSDERSRGNLDILLGTPIRTRAIVRAKWWAAFARVPKLMMLPFLIGLALSFQPPIRFLGGSAHHSWMTPILVIMLAVLPVSAGAFLTSLSMYIATAVQSFGRAVGIAIAIYVVLAIGWPMFAIGGSADPMILVVSGSPGFGSAFITAMIQFDVNDNRKLLLIGAAYWSLVYLLLAHIFYFLTLRCFNRCMGRINQRPTRPVLAKRKQVGRELGVEWVEPRGMP